MFSTVATTFQLLVWFVFSLTFVSSMKYYVTPESATPCPYADSPCFTLSEYASKPNNYFKPETELILLSGVHNLKTVLSIERIEQLKLISNYPTSQITCNPSTMLDVRQTRHLSVVAIQFSGCVNNAVTAVEQFTLENCTFDSLDYNGTGIVLECVSYMNIVGTRFSSFTAVNTSKTNGNGGAIYSNNIENATMLWGLCPSVMLHLNETVQSGVLSKIAMKNCTFAKNKAINGGAMYVDGSNIEIDTTSFMLNSADVNGGALSSQWLGCHWIPRGQCYYIEFSHNVGTNVNATSGAVFIDGHHIVSNVVIKDTLFLNNTAFKGGAIYAKSTTLLCSGYFDVQSNSGQSGIVYLFISSVRFEGNVSISNNQGSLFAFNSNVTFEGHANIVHNSFINNLSATHEGGALTGFQSEIAFIGRVIIMYNRAINGSGGAIYMTESKIHTYGELTIARNAAISGGGIYSYQCELNFRGNTKIIDNEADEKGGGVHGVSSTISLWSGSLIISNNSAQLGGGMYLEVNAKLYIIKTQGECIRDNDIICVEPDKWLKLEFADNTASNYGGALFVSDETYTCGAFNTSSVEQSTATECVFQTLAAHISYSVQLNLINVYFVNNSANKGGDALYGGLLDRCRVSYFAEIFHKYTSLTPSSLDAMSYYSNLTGIQRADIKPKVASSPLRVCFCQETTPDCNYQPPTYHVKKGQLFKVPLVAVDQVENTYASYVTAYLNSHDGGFGVSQSIQNTSKTCTNLVYNVSSPLQFDYLIFYVSSGVCRDIGSMSQRYVKVVFLPCTDCPIGFSVKDSNCICECDPRLFPEFVSACSLSTESVQTRGTAWINFVNSTENQGFITYPYCPFDYCSSESVWINFNTDNGADAQCAHNRSGKLCGSCEDGLSLSLGSSHCLLCSNSWLALLVVFAIAGIALVSLVLVCNLTVAVGTLNGLVFYTNIIATNRDIFFPFETPKFVTVFISWCNLDFGLVTCFYSGMDGYAKSWLQLVFPAYIITLVIVIIILCDWSSQFARRISSKNPIATLATLILLSYTKFIHTIIAAGQSAHLLYPDGSRERVWLIDGNVGFLEGKHIPLFITALLILTVGLVYTFVLLFWQWLVRCSNTILCRWIENTKLYSFIDAYHAPYSTNHRYWTGLLLLARILLYLVAALNIHGDPSVNLLSIICVVGGLLLLTTVMKDKIYKSWPIHVVESTCLFNLVIFSAATCHIRETGKHSQHYQAYLAYTSTTIAFITFIVIVIYHTFKYALPNSLKRIVNHISTLRPFTLDVGAETQYPLDGERHNPIRDSGEICTYTEIDILPPPPPPPPLNAAGHGKPETQARLVRSRSSDETTPLLQ